MSALPSACNSLAKCPDDCGAAPGHDLVEALIEHLLGSHPEEALYRGTDIGEAEFHVELGDDVHRVFGDQTGTSLRSP
jgi:hypothetical protein